MGSGWLTLRLSLDHSVWGSVQVLTTWSRICLIKVWCLQRSLFGYATFEAYWIWLWCCLKLATGCVGSGPLERVLVQANARRCLELQVIHSLCLPLLAERAKLCTTTDFYQHQALGWVNKSPEAPARVPPPSASTCWLPVRLSHWNSLWLYSAGCKLHMVDWEGVQMVGLLLSHGLILQIGECSTQERSCLQCGRGT